jgi:hypothetical protein
MAAAMLLALAPASGLAAPGGNGNGVLKILHSKGCRLSMSAEPHLLTAGETAQLFGVLRCASGITVEGQTINIFEHTAGLGGYKMVGPATTGPGGAYTFVTSPIVFNSVFYAAFGGSKSANRTVRAAPQVTFGGPAEGSQLRTGVPNRVTFAGIVSPADAGATVVLQRENATSVEEWHAIQESIVKPGGGYVFTHTFRVPGDANLRALVRPHRRLTARGVSNAVSYEISQAQNPLLTIFTSADPAAFGTPVTISGVLAGGANKKVTLTGRMFGSGGFSNVQETVTDGSGAYKFVVASAVQSTGYRVQSATGIHSAVLFEGVRYALMATPSASTVQAGTPLTISGTVAPARAGKVVYLERQNPGPTGGYHVVDLTVVSSIGTYSISHFIFGSGKQVYRVHIPGDPDNQAVSTPPFPIEVTAAPPGSLRPVPQGTLPH